MASTVKQYQFGKAPRKIILRGDKHAQTESAQHTIEFPGGAIELSRLDDGSYWAHIIVNRSRAIEDCEGLVSCVADIADSRIDYQYPANPNVIPIPNADMVEQIAVRIRRKP